MIFWQTISLDGERLFLRMVGADHDGVGNLDDIDLGDDFLGKLCLWMVSTYDDVVDENYQVRLSELAS